MNTALQNHLLPPPQYCLELNSFNSTNPTQRSVTLEFTKNLRPLSSPP